MKKDTSKKSVRTNAILTAAIAIAVGAGLLVLSHLVHKSAMYLRAADDAKAAATTKPAATAPAPGTPERPKPVNQRAAYDDRMSGLLLLFAFS